MGIRLSVALQLGLLLLPWRLRRLGLRLLGYRIDRTARIGASIVHARCVTIGAHAKIGHLTWIAHLDELTLGAESTIGHLNWLTGCKAPQVFGSGRVSALQIGWHSAILNRHHIDCTDSVTIGEWTNVAGWGTQILTHGFNPAMYAIYSRAVVIGDRCMIGTRAIILAGTVLGFGNCVGAGATVKGGTSSRAWSWKAFRP